MTFHCRYIQGKHFFLYNLYNISLCFIFVTFSHILQANNTRILKLRVPSVRLILESNMSRYSLSLSVTEMSSLYSRMQLVYEHS